MDKLTLAISQALSENNYINQEDVEIYRYGIEMFIICVLEISAVLLVSIIVGNFFETIIFLIGFTPIRIYSGGYHANTRLRCFVILFVVYAAFSILNASNFISEYSVFAFSAACLTVLLSTLWAPLPNANKKLNDKEQQHYRKMCILNSSLSCIIVTIILFLGAYNVYTQAFILGMFTALISLVIGKIKLFIQMRRCKNE